MKPWTSPNYEGRAPWTVQACLNGQKMAEQTARWIEKNEDDFYALYAIVKEFQAKGFRGRLRDRVVTEAMNRGVRFEDKGYMFANGLWAGITRYMVVMDPTLKDDPIEFLPSDIDNYGLVPIEFRGKK